MKKFSTKKRWLLAALPLLCLTSFASATEGGGEEAVAAPSPHLFARSFGSEWDGVSFSGLPAEAVFRTWAQGVVGAEVRLGLSAQESVVENLRYASGRPSSAYYAVSQPVYRSGNAAQEVVGVLTTFRYLARPASAGMKAQLSAPIAHPTSEALEAKRVIGYLQTAQQVFRLERTGDVSGQDQHRIVGEGLYQELRSGFRVVTSSS